MNRQRLLFNFQIGIEAISLNKSRAVLTSLGIVFGVAAVISMLAIGNGAQQEILEQIKQVGSNNIIINAVTGEGEEVSEQDKLKPKKFSAGLTLQDAENILHTIEKVKYISPEIEVKTTFMASEKVQEGKLIGINNNYFNSAMLELESGHLFNATELEFAQPVCILGKEIKSRFFPSEDPIGKKVKCGNTWFTVVGLLKDKVVSKGNEEKLSIRSPNMDIYAPVTSVLMRVRDRSRLTKADIELQNNKYRQTEETEKQKTEKKNYHQLDRLVINVEDSRYIKLVAELSERLLNRRHNGVKDFEIVVPELLLKQEQKTKQLFNTVLGVIASISLVVGGIGIMNIMLASVLERIKEIGVRQSLGATRNDIALQFIGEAMAISISGGLLGILLGVVLSFAIQYFTGITTIISPLSIIVSFFISISVGLVFGIAPAKKAAQQDPVTSLRHE